MKLVYRFCAVLFLIYLYPIASTAQTILLPDRWHFTTGDKPEFTNPQFDDSSWVTVNVPDWWEREGYDNYDGNAWYRVRFNANKKLFGDSVYVLLGKIDDADETYLNGKLIGKMGKFPPNPVTAYNELRVYRIPSSMLEQENVLAVRVNDSGGAGGIVGGPVGIYNKKDFENLINPPAGPKKSFYQLVTSNGLIAAVYNQRFGYIEKVLPHIFQAYDSARFVEPFVRRIMPTTKERPAKTFYNGNTHVITVSYPGFEINYLAPFTTEEKVFYAVVSGSKNRVTQCFFTYEKTKTKLLVDSLLIELPKGRAEKYFLFGFNDSLHTDSGIVTKAKERLIKSNGGLVQNEIKFMKNVFARCTFPKGINSAERAVLEQSISVLKMAQVPSNEVFPKAVGQILASLPPGGWNISWVRDGSYSILGLNRLGLFDEAKRFLSFMLNAESDHYEHYIFRDGKDYGVGVPYQISLTRYFGIGKEECDYTDNGPNIELDGFGLYLIAICDYVQRSGDTLFFKTNYEKLAGKIGDAIIHCIDTNNVIRIDSGPWERHLPGKQFAYTSIACAAGLRDFAALSSRMHLGDAEKYKNAYERLMNGIRKNLLVDNKIFKGNVEAKDPNAYDYFDGGTIEAFTFGLFPDKKLFNSQLNEYRRELGVKGGIHGFSRINKGDWYEVAEWLLLDLRAASAMKKFGDPKGAHKMINWVTKQASLNFNLIPELYNEKTSFYDGAIPMVGFGAGAYAIALSDLYK